MNLDRLLEYLAISGMLGSARLYSLRKKTEEAA